MKQEEIWIPGTIPLALDNLFCQIKPIYFPIQKKKNVTPGPGHIKNWDNKIQWLALQPCEDTTRR